LEWSRVGVGVGIGEKLGSNISFRNADDRRRM